VVKLSIGKTLLGGAVLGALGAKIYLFKKFRDLQSGGGGGATPAWMDRRTFGGLPRRKQREVVYAKRAQLRDLESIAYSGYRPRRSSGGQQRRHTFLTRNRWRMGG